MPSKLSNPASTGGAGSNFEVKVLTSFLTTMICGAPCPAFPENTISKIRLQSKQAGFETDDILVETTDKSGGTQKLLGQIKHEITFTKGSETFRDVLESAWNDFSNPEVFNQGQDAIAIITGPISKQDINHVRRVPDLARHCANAEEFYEKINTSVFSSQKKKGFTDAVLELVKGFSGDAFNSDDVWRFLCSLHFLSYDFDTTSSVDYAQFLSLIEISKSRTSKSYASALWSQLYMLVSGYNQNAGTIEKSNLDEVLPKGLSEDLLSSALGKRSESIQRLLKHSNVTVDKIKTTVGKGISLPRTALIERCLSLFESSQILLITNEAGGGKSALAKTLLERLQEEAPVFAFRAEEFDYPHLDQAFTAMGVSEQFQDLSVNFGLLPNRVFIIDSVEKLLEMSSQQAFSQLLSEVSKNDKWRLLLTCRTHAEQWLVAQILDSFGAPPATVRVPNLSDTEIQSVANQVPLIKDNLSNKALMDVLKNPFFLSIACKTIPDVLTEGYQQSKEDIRKILWREAVRKPSRSSDGMPDRREEQFIAIAVKRAEFMQPYVQMDTADLSALNALCDDNIVTQIDGGLVAPSHDLFEDLAVEEYIERCFRSHGKKYQDFFKKIGSEPALRRAFRHWLVSTLSSGDINLLDLVIEAACSADLNQFWKDEIWVGILLSEEAENILIKLKSKLFENDKFLLLRVMHLLQTACKEPNYPLIAQLGLEKPDMALSSVYISFMRPAGYGWAATINFISDNIDQLDVEQAGIIKSLLNEWCGIVHVDDLPSDTMISASKIALNFYKKIKEAEGWSRGLEEDFLKILVKIPQAQPEDVTSLYDEFNSDDNHTTRILVEAAVSSLECFYLCKHLPDVVINSVNSLTRPRPRPKGRSGPYFSDDNYTAGTEGYFGLGRTFSFRMNPSSAYQGPFLYLLRWHPEKALAFTIDFLNQAAEKYAVSNLDGPQILSSFELPNGTTKEVISGYRLWCIYRGVITVGPNFLEACLMALEEWLIECAKNEDDLSSVATYIFENSKSVMPISVLSSAAIAHPEAFGDSILPLFSSLDFYKMDRHRMFQERTATIDIRETMGFPTGGVQDVYYDERKRSAKQEHRKQDLEAIVAKLQFSEMRPRIYNVLDSVRANYQEPDDIESKNIDSLLFKRVDIRNWDVVEKTSEGVMIGPKIDEPELKAMVDGAGEDLSELSRWLGLHNWSASTFNGEASEQDWRDMLKNAMEFSEVSDDDKHVEFIRLTNVVAYAASSFVLNYSEELNQKELEWCADVVCTAIKDKAYLEDSMEWVQKHTSHGSRPSAFVLPIIIKNLDDKSKLKVKVKETLAIALTCGVEEIEDFAIAGVKRFLWSYDSTLAERCFHTLLWKAVKAGKLSSQRRLDRENYVAEYIACLKLAQSNLINAKKPIETFLPETIKIDEVESKGLLQAFSIVKDDDIDTYYRQWLLKILTDLVADISEDQKGQGGSRLSNAYEFHFEFNNIYANALLNCEAAYLSDLLHPLIASMTSTTKVIEEIAKDLLYIADRKDDSDRFWAIWTPIAEQVFSDEKGHWKHHELIKILLFSRTQWKKDAKTWKPLEENKEFILNSFSLVGHTEAGFYALNRLLHTVGAFLLPDALIDLNNARLRADRDILSDKNTRYELEMTLRKAVFMHGATIRGREKARIACLQLLDELVNRGSSLSFQLRELLISPIRAKAA